jgi:hypothetical protein
MFPGLDPSKMDPRVLMELSRLVQELPQEKLAKMQTLMHNMMAGFDVRKEMEEFERTLPAGFREKIAALMAQSGAAMPTQGTIVPPGAEAAATEVAATPEDMDLRQARLTILRAVAAGSLSPEEAERHLFAGG